jgi:hypothetical protein
VLQESSEEESTAKAAQKEKKEKALSAAPQTQALPSIVNTIGTHRRDHQDDASKKENEVEDSAVTRSGIGRS